MATKEPDRWQCCFCGQTIALVRSAAITLEVVSDTETRQGLQAHPACLRAALHPSVPLQLDDRE